jgi:hypothetical protein
MSINYTKLKFLAVSAIILAISLQSCYKDRFGLDEIAGGELEHSLAAPAVNSKLSMKRLIEEGNSPWVEDSDGFLSLVYSDTITSKNPSEVFQISDYSSLDQFALNIPPTLLPGDSDNVFLLNQPEMTFSGGETIDSVLFKSGTIEFTIETNLNHNARVEIIIPDLKKYGVTFFKSVDLKYNGGTSNTYSLSFPLNLYTLTLDTTQTGGRKFTEYFKVIVKMSTNSNNSPYVFEVNQEIKNATYYSVWGYFGQKNYGVGFGNIEIPLFNNNAGGQITFDNILVDFEVINDNAIDFNLKFDEFYVEKDGNRTNFISPLMPDFEIYGIDYDSIHESKSTFYSFDKSNSNIVDLINLNPDRVRFKTQVTSNPNWSSLNKNFLLDTGAIDIKATLTVPMFGKALDAFITDTFDLDIESIDELRKLEIRINAYNAFPTEASVQLYFADSNRVLLDSVFSQEEMIIESGVVGPAPDYKVTQPTHKLTVIDLSEAKLENLYTATKGIVKIRVNTYNQAQDFIKLYSDNYVDVKVAFKADTKINL